MPPVTRPVILAALLAAALAGGAYLFWRSRHPALPDGLVQANGRIEGDHVLIASKFPGRLAKVLVREGDTVQAGQVLAELDEAKRTGDLVDVKTGKKLNELNPNLYPAKVSASTVTRAQVLAELAEAKRTGDIVDSKSGKKLNELFPNNYPKAS